jgi:GT2 family glycosyltransferase
VTFNRAFEFGYGEDVDFGCQLRNRGADIIYLPDIKIRHLKVPIGGFRSTFKQPWSEDEILPKPSPTVMLNSLLNKTNAQLLGYKTQLCIKYYFVQKIKQPLRYYRTFLKQWERSKYWAEHLQSSNKERK